MTEKQAIELPVEYIEASDLQREYWLHHYDPENAGRPEVFVSSWLTRDLDIKVLERTIGILSSRHDALRCCFVETAGRVMLGVQESGYASIKVDVLQLPDDPAGQVSEEEFLQTRINRVCDLKSPPLFRMHVCRRGDGSCTLYMVLHHIIADAISIDILKAEINRVYRLVRIGAGDEFGPLPGQLSEYCRYQVRHSRQRKDQHRQFWKSRMHSMLTQVRPWAGGAGIEPGQGKTTSFTYTLDMEHCIDLRQLARSAGCSFWSLMYASLGRLFFRVFDAAGIIVASTVMDRGIRNGMSIIGNLIGGIYLHIKYRPETAFIPLMKEVHLDFVKASRHLIYDHDCLEGVDRTQLRYRSNVFAVFEPLLQGAHRELGFMRTGFSKEDGCYYPLSFTATELSDGMALKWVFHEYFFSPPQVENMAETHIAILKETTYGKSTHCACSIS